MTLDDINQLDAQLQRERLLKDLAAEFVALWIQNGSNPVEDDPAYREAFLEKLACAQVRELRDLMAADQVMDAIVVPEIRDAAPVRSLDLKVRAFIERFPQLLDMGWVHSDGYVFRLLYELRTRRDTPDAQVVLSSFRLSTS